MFEFFKNDSECPCRSGRTGAECCLPDRAPIEVPGSGIENLRAEMEHVGPSGERLPIPRDLKISATINFPSQLDWEVEGLVDRCRNAVRIREETRGVDWTRQATAKAQALSENLYAVRHHERSFLVRLRRLTIEQALLFARPQGNVALRFNDRPLHYELEAFLTRSSGALDALAHFASALAGVSSRKWGEFCHLKLKPDAENEYAAAIRPHLEWVEELRDRRNTIVHEGNFAGFEGVGHQHGLLLDAKVGNWNAGWFCVRSWRSLRELVTATVEVDVTYEQATSDDKTKRRKRANVR